MLCADPSLSGMKLKATSASSATEPPPIKPIRAWRETPSGDLKEVGGGEDAGWRKKRE